MLLGPEERQGGLVWEGWILRRNGDLFFFFFGYSDILFFDINRIYLGGLVIFCFRLIGVCVDNCCLRAPLIFNHCCNWRELIGL